jgi:alpha-D-xyloside xylohydrolase
MAESLRGGLSLGLSGFGFWSHDIGGFEGTPPAAVYKRWLAFGLLSSHSRLHGSNSYRVPWLFDEEAVDVLRKFTRLKLRLMPYLFGHALEAHEKGLPMMRAMLLEFPDDPACDYLDRQYMLGESLLVAPVFSTAGRVRYYLPAGRWTDFFSGKVITGPGWQEESHDFISLPLMVRPNAVIALGKFTNTADYDYAEGVRLEAYELADGQQKVFVPNPAGKVEATFTLTRRGNSLEVVRQGNYKPWQLLLVGVHSVTQVEGGTAETTERGVLVTASGADLNLMLE